MPHKTTNQSSQTTTKHALQTYIPDTQHIITVDNKEYILKIIHKPPCSDACPAGINVKAYINLIANKKFEEAIELIRENNPFPAVCGRVCTRPCENECLLAEYGDSVPIRALKRYASDYELARRPLKITPCPLTKKEKIAIIGAGPAGLTAAVDLIRKGYPITVFEKETEPGGMLRYAIPTYRLPDRTLKREIDWIQQLGITIKTQTNIKNPTSLLKKGYSAVLIATGTPTSILLTIPGNDTKGILDPLNFLKAINQKKPPTITGDVLVIGGGSTAFDAARSAKRLGAQKVTIAYRRTINEMPADIEEIHEAQNEGIKIQTLALPQKILIEHNKATGVEFLTAKLGKPDSSGRKRPEPIPNSEYIIPAHTIIPAIGAKPNIGIINGKTITNPDGTIQITQYGKTSLPALYAAGDVETGPTSIVEAIGRGHQAAQGIHSYLQKSPEEQPKPTIQAIQIHPNTKPISTQQYTPAKKHHQNITTFEEIDQTYTEYQAVEEAQRCYSCGSCHTCPTCLPNCTNKQVTTTINNQTILTKAPHDLALSITQNGPLPIQITTNNTKTDATLTSLIATIDKNICIGCGRCEELCAYHAITTTLTKDHQIYATISPTTCAACSTCISKCPSGAIQQGYMTDSKILHRIQQKNTTYNGVIAFTSHWHTPSTLFDTHKGTIDLMSLTKPSPTFLIQALAHAGRGLLIIHPPNDTDYHYLPWEENPTQVIQQTQDLLTQHGISPNRIKQITQPKETDPTDLIKKYITELDTQKISPYTIPLPDTIQSPLGKTFAILRMMSAKPDNPKKPKHLYLPPAKKGDIAYFEGCIPLLAKLGTIQKLYNLETMQKNQIHLIKQIYPTIATLPNLTCPSKSLLDIKHKETEKIVQTIAQKNQQTLTKTQPQKIIIATPEAYTSLSAEQNIPPLSTLPDELLPLIKKLKTSTSIKKTIALHKACHLHTDPFYQPTKQLLESIPGITIIDFPRPCGHTSFESLNSQTKKTANTLMKNAKDKGADNIICTSPYCQAHLQLSQRQGSWQTIEIDIGDIYTLITTIQEDQQQ